MPRCSIELNSLVPGDMHECLPALPAAPQHVVLMHHSCVSLHVPRQLNITYGHVGDVALRTESNKVCQQSYIIHGRLGKVAVSTLTTQGQTLTCCRQSS